MECYKFYEHYENNFAIVKVTSFNLIIFITIFFENCVSFIIIAVALIKNLNLN